MSTNTADSRPVFTGENVFNDHGIKVYVEHRVGRPYVALLIHGETTWLCIEEARHLADHLPEKLQSAASDIEQLNAAGKCGDVGVFHV